MIGTPDPKWGERVHGVVVLRDGAVATEPELLAWCGQRVAGFKRPRALTIIGDTEMPRTATGKIQHGLLRERIVAMKCE